MSDKKWTVKECADDAELRAGRISQVVAFMMEMTPEQLQLVINFSRKVRKK